MMPGAVRTAEKLHAAGITYKGTDKVIPAQCHLCGANLLATTTHICWVCQHPEISKIRDEFWKITER